MKARCLMPTAGRLTRKVEVVFRPDEAAESELSAASATEGGLLTV